MIYCLQLFGNVSYSLYTTNNNNRDTNRMEPEVDIFPGKKLGSFQMDLWFLVMKHLSVFDNLGKKKNKKAEKTVAPVITLEMPD